MYGTNRAFTCGYFPQSFELASVGGWIAALGTGQASTYYGDAYDLVISQEYVTPVGTIRTKDFPASATGPKVNDIPKGNEARSGCWSKRLWKIFRYQPENTQRFAFMLPNWDAAVEFSREVVQGEFGMPAILRISDPEETERGLALRGSMRAWPTHSSPSVASSRGSAVCVWAPQKGRRASPNMSRHRSNGSPRTTVECR